LIIPILYYIFKISGKKLSGISVVELGLASMLFIAMCVSYWFWSNPIQNGISHTIDGIIAKITIFVFLFYIFVYKQLGRDFVFILFVLLLVFFVIMSHRASSEEWCSRDHLFYHGGVHLIAASSAFYAFIRM
jgi:hypothetical protein